MQVADDFAQQAAKIDLLFLRDRRPGKLHELRQGLVNTLGLTDDRLQGFAASRLLLTDH